MIRSAGPSPLLLYKNHVTRAGGENRAERTTTAGWKEDRKQPRQRVTADIEAPWTHAQRPAQADVQPLSRVDTRFTLLLCKKLPQKITRCHPAAHSAAAHSAAAASWRKITFNQRPQRRFTSFGVGLCCCGCYFFVVD